jgi:hypothetical protein
MGVSFTGGDAEIDSVGTEEMRRWPGPATWAERLCDKLTTQMTAQQWHDWVLPDSDAIAVCPDPPKP